MNTVNRLRREHALFRSNLNVLEAALRLGPEARYALRERCCSLAKQLEDHTRREEDLRCVFHAAVSHASSPVPFTDHTVERGQAAFINRFLLRYPNAPLGRIEPTITLFVSALRDRMEQQESTVFPVVEDALVLSEVSRLLEAERPPWDLSETMTVGEVLACYPAAGPVLERLFINPACERYDALDEVAWRHGMESQDLLARLEEELARGLAPERQRARAVLGAAFRADPYEWRSPVLAQAVAEA